MVRVEGVEPSFHPWEGYIIAVIRYPHGADGEIRTRDPRFTNPAPFGAVERGRTADLRFTKAPLYQLSYDGKMMLKVRG